MKYYTIPIITAIVLFFVVTSGCKKQDDFLDTKPNEALAVPTSLADLQLLVSNEDVFNRNYPALGETSTDDYFLDPSLWAGDFITDKNAYIWAKDIYSPGSNVADWNFPYQQVYYANTVLNVIASIKPNSNQQTQFNTVKGSALFFRAMAFYNLVQTFAMPYDSTTATKDLGIPLPLTPDINAKIGRSTESQCYSQIIGDLNEAALLLPDQPSKKTQPSKVAVFGLLSRIYLVMGNYALSLNYSNSFLAIYNSLQDFNKLNPAAFPVYPNFSPEEVFHASLTGYTSNGFQAQVDSNLFKSFNDSNDLRPSIYFYNNSGQVEFNSQFDYKNSTSSTISTDEILLNKAECEARLNSNASALADLNSLLITRWVTGTYKNISSPNADSTLVKILRERRKELVFTGSRWSDLRRLNKDPRFATTIYRNLNGTIYSLPPNDPRYALPIPDNELQLNPMPQNNR
jgi:hypothetical protein